MPSPVGHGLAGLAAGWAVAGPAADRRERITQAALFAFLGAAPDLDLFFDRHRYETHSIGAAVLAGALVAAVKWPVARTRTRIFLAAMAAWATHPLLDMLAPDHWPPFGVEAFWPFSRGFYITGVELFLGTSRAWDSPLGWLANANAAMREVMIVSPVVGLVYWLRTRRRKIRGPISGRGDLRSPSA